MTIEVESAAVQPSLLCAAAMRWLSPFRLSGAILLLSVGCASGAIDVVPSSGSDDSSGGSGDGVSGAPHESTPEPGWCEVQAVLIDKCQRCHGDVPDHGAPFALVSYEDTQVVSAKGEPRFRRIAKVVESGSMPATYLKLEPVVEPLADGERELLLDWCAREAPGAVGDCAAER